MKHTTKLILILVIIGLLSATLYGCNKKNTDPTRPEGQSTEAATEAPAEPLTQYGNFSTTAPVRTLEEIFANEVAKDKTTFAAGSTYTEEQINNVYKIADRIANYKEFVEKYNLHQQLDDLYEETGFTLDLGFGANMMQHYLGATAETYDFTERLPELLSHPKVSASQTTCINAAMKAAENLVPDGQTVAAINQSKPMLFKSLKTQDGSVYYALGSYGAMADLSNVQRTGNTMTATVTFRITDYYDWDETITTPEFADYLDRLNDDYRALFSDVVDFPTLEGFCQADMAQLHNAGFAQNFMAFGTIVYQITWTVGQTFDQATVTTVQ